MIYYEVIVITNMYRYHTVCCAKHSWALIQERKKALKVLPQVAVLALVLLSWASRDDHSVCRRQRGKHT